MGHIDAAQTSYERDFVAWTADQARLLRERRLAAVDVTHLVEEIEDLGNNTRRQLESRLEILVSHLLKWEFQQQRRSSGWQRTIVVQRRDIAQVLHRNPSLRVRNDDFLRESYGYALRLAEAETGLPRDAFPPACIWTVEQVLDDSFWPGPDAPAL